jgi:hypothetical protein
MSGPNAEAASLGEDRRDWEEFDPNAEDIPCAAGVRGDGACSFELCPPGIGCRRVREQRQQGEGGPALPPKWSETNTERAAWLLNPTRPTFCGEPIQDSGCRYCKPGQCNWSLVAQARAEERERIATRFDSADGDGWGSLAPVVTGLFEQVARIVRGMS